MIRLFLFLISFVVTVIKPAINKRSFLNVESSAIGLRSSCKEELEAIMISYLQNPDDNHLFYSLLKSRYFDYSSVLLSICEVIDDQRLHKIVSDSVENHLPEELVADCICVSAKNGPWYRKLKFPVNPLISSHFNAKDWNYNQLKHFSGAAIQDQNIKTRWSSLAQADHEKLQLFFDPQLSLWKMIKVVDITDTTKALFIAKNLVRDVKPIDIHDKSEEFMCKMMILTLIKRKFPESQMIQSLTNKIFNRLRTFLLETDKNNLLLKLESFDYFEEILLKIKPIATPAIILNFLGLFKDHMDEELFEKTLNIFFINPTINEVCILLQMSSQRRVYSIISLYLSSRIDLLFGVFRECPQTLPEKVVRVYIPLQLRLQQTLKKHRKLVKRSEKLVFNLPNLSLSAKEQFNFIQKELNDLFMEIDYKEFDVYNYPVLDPRRQKKSFVMAIDRFFSSFFNREDYYVLLEDGSIIPDLVNLDPKSLESIGYFLGAAIILQHPISFKLNEGYFSLLRSNFIPEYHRILFEVYPQRFKTELPISILAKQLEIGVNYLYSGFQKALEAQYFSTNELYQLLFP